MRDDDTPQATSRPGGEATGGIAPRADDPDTPEAARGRQADDRARHHEAGFGDDKGGDAE